MLFVPLDIPKFEYSDKVAKEFSMTRFYNCWEVETITEPNYSNPIGSITKIKKTHPELVDFVIEHFPFTGIVCLELFKCVKDIPEHVDNSYLPNDNTIKKRGEDETNMYITPEFRKHQLEIEPSGYRMMFFGDRQSLYYRVNEEKKHMNLPEETDSYVLQTYDATHGCDLTKKDHNRLVLFAMGWVNKTRHHNLISRSINKYSKYCI